ncbi:MAG: hypothetical protein NTZ09_07195 [Candidatus Hydrogenedentes bacterium]|nr:hypothetical protein [Candidatus Hydrogenedentota bacterium]
MKSQTRQMPGAGLVEKLHIVRNFILLAILAFVIIVICGLWWVAQPLAPAESSEHAAMRDSQDNAYLVLLDALKSFPANVPPPLVVSSAGGKPINYKPLRDSIARRLGIARPDDDPQVLTYLAQCAPVLEKTRQAFAKPYCLLPSDLAAKEMDGALDYPASFELEKVGALLGACAIDAFNKKDFQQASQYVFDLLRLCLMLRDDSLWMAGGMMMDVTVNYLVRVLPQLPPDVLQPALDTVRELRKADRPPVDSVRFTLRASDGAINNTADSEMQGKLSFIRIPLRIYWNWPLKKTFSTYKSVAKAASLPYPEFNRLLPPDTGSASPPDEFPRRSIDLLNWTVAAPLQTDAMLAGLEVRMVLDLYRQKQGTYPEKLEDLQQIAPELPPDPFSGKPFIYRKISNTECTLYSIGPNLRDDNALGDDCPLGTDAPPKPKN